MNSSSESMSRREGEPCSVTGVVGPCAGTMDVFRVFADPCFNASETLCSAFLFLIEGVVVASLDAAVSQDETTGCCDGGDRRERMSLGGDQRTGVTSEQHKVKDSTRKTQWQDQLKWYM